MKTETEILTEEIAEKFIGWSLPESVCADLCATKQGPQRIGTNLLSYVEARQMARDVVIPVVTAKLAAKDAEMDALRDALQALQDIVNGKRNDPEKIAEILNGALRRCP